MVDIEVFGFFRKRMNHERSHTDILSNPIATKYRIL